LNQNAITYTLFTSNSISLKAGPAIGQLILQCYCTGLLQRNIYKMHLLTLGCVSLSSSASLSA